MQATLSPHHAPVPRTSVLHLYSERDELVSTNGVTANVMFFDRGTFGVLPLTYFYLPKSTKAYLFHQSVKMNYFCSGPIRVDPICLQSSIQGRQ